MTARFLAEVDRAFVRNLNATLDNDELTWIRSFRRARTHLGRNKARPAMGVWFRAENLALPYLKVVVLLIAELFFRTDGTLCEGMVVGVALVPTYGANLAKLLNGGSQGCG